MRTNRESRIHRLALVLACAILVAATLPLRAGDTQAPAPDARSILKKMATYVGSQATIQYTFDSDIEIITPEIEKIQFASSGGALVQRPDKIRAHRKGGFADVEFVFDGKLVSVLGKSINGYAQFEAPGTLDQLIEVLRAGYGVALPSADLLKTNAYDILVADVKEAKYIGRGVVDGVECEHLAFRNFDTDWQLWVEAGDKAIPRKMVITSKTMAAAPQYTVRIKSWKSDVKVAPNAFVFVPPQGAAKVAPDGLVDLDELPRGAE